MKFTTTSRTQTQHRTTLCTSEIGRERIFRGKSNNCNTETCAHHVTSRYGNKESRANNLSSLPDHSSMFKKTIIPTNERKWVVFPANPLYGGALSIQVSKMVTRMVRHYDQEEREPDGSHHWDTVRPVLLKSFGRHGAQIFSERSWIQLIQEGSSVDQKNSLCYLRAIQGHSSGIPIMPELMGYTSVPCNWKDFIFHRGCS